ncbi:MAG TPA: hypothetical protein VFU00_11740 [Gemmatimonadales bacterium]|nr:hypothetical protein [Gemmatimonadales bacterium]
MPSPTIAPARLSGKTWHRGHRVLMPRGGRSYRLITEQRIRLPGLLGAAGAAVVGIACGLFDLRTGRSDTTAFIVGVAAMASALLAVNGAIARAVIIAAGIPLVYAVATILQLSIPFPPDPNLLATIVVIVPALAGALLGVAVRRLAAGRGSLSP